MTFVFKDERLCEKCKTYCLSGIAHIDRGHVGAVICHSCATPSEYAFMRAQTERKALREKLDREARASRT
jgi:hypothetical protein